MPRQTRKRKNTETSAFGTSGRISHDASTFYNSRLYHGIERGKQAETSAVPIPPQALNQIYCKSSQSMEELPSGSVHLMVTSPPYNATKNYDQNLTLDEYLAFLEQVWRETYRVLAPGGRACVNVANLGRKPYIPLHAYLVDQMAKIGFLMRGEIIWNKGTSASSSTAWGSWCSAANPVLRDVHEYILVFSKDTFSRKKEERENTIRRDEFLEWTKSVWSFPAVSAKKIGHPAPFPEELPRRLIQLFTFRGDVILDPFAGSGTTCIAAAAADRSYVGYELDESYVRLANQRLAAAR